MRLNTFKQASCARSVRTPSVHTTRRSPAPIIKPRAGSRLHHTSSWSNSSDTLNPQLTEWAQARMKAMVVDLKRLNEQPRLTDTELAKPWRTVLVPAERLEQLRHVDYPCAGSSTMLWGIGPERPVANCNPYDVNPLAIDFERCSSRPGKGPFRDVVRGAYGNRNFKYLWAIDHRGMHIAREMMPCKLSSRGIITHSILVDRGVIGGEIFFDLDDPGKVYLNFGSARLPLEDGWQAEKTAEFVLALGYHTVVAMIPDRRLSEHPYGMADRYGKRVQNMVFRQEEGL